MNRGSEVSDKAPIPCPNCPDQGWYAVANHYTGEPEQEQCEFCYTVENSMFNYLNGNYQYEEKVDNEQSKEGEL